jgi:4-carboxymuconolactone decarboxylase
MSRMPLADVPDDLPVTNNLVRSLYHNPDLYRAFGRLAMQVHASSHLAPRTRELVVLWIAGGLGAPYQWTQHRAAAARVGISDGEIADVEARHLSHFSPDEQLALRFAQAVEDRSMTDGLWEQAAAAYDPQSLLDLSLLATFYGLASRLTLAFEVPLDD